MVNVRGINLAESLMDAARNRALHHIRNGNDVGCLHTALTDVNLTSDKIADFVVLKVKKMRFIRTTCIVQTWRFLECSEVPRVAMLQGA